MIKKFEIRNSKYEINYNIKNSHPKDDQPLAEKYKTIGIQDLNL